MDAAARRLAERHAGTLLYDSAARYWFVFDGTMWRRDRGILRTIRDILRASGIADPWPGLVAAVEQLVRTEPELAPSGASDPDALWDRDPWRLGEVPGSQRRLVARLERKG